MSYRAGHDTECCTGKVNRAMPNYVTRRWMWSDAGLAAVLYGPSEVHAKISGQSIRITEDTDYPFRDTVNFRVKMERPQTFSLYLRIPEWCSQAGIKVNG